MNPGSLTGNLPLGIGEGVDLASYFLLPEDPAKDVLAAVVANVMKLEELGGLLVDWVEIRDMTHSH